MAEAGQAGFAAVSWIGVFLPASAPDALVARLNAALKTASQDATIRDRMAALGFELVASPPEQLQAFVAGEIQRWTEVVKRHNIKVE
jgi:tripartite-type tricarboxylate transporter receptor subunit TctC